ncbi:MAG: hypothetical protein ACOYNS_18245 [Bacteroidota bacterium]
MNRISVTANVRQYEGEEPTISADIEIDGTFTVGNSPSGLAVDLYELIKSTKRNGRYFILTCSCGMAECAGIKQGVSVRHHRNEVRWTIYDMGRVNNAPIHFTFDSALYKREIRNALQHMIDIKELHPTFEITPQLMTGAIIRQQELRRKNKNQTPLKRKEYDSI